MSGILGLGLGVANTIIGQSSQDERERRAMHNQQQLMDLQQQHQRGLNAQGQYLQMKTWRDTNYSAQMDEIKKAGLNPALLYGMGGTGGATTGSQGGGSAQGGQAPSPQQLDIRAIMDAIKTVAQTGLAKAQTETEKNRPENVQADTDRMKADTLNTQIQTDINKVSLKISKATQEHEIDRAIYEVEGIIKFNNLTDEQVNQVKADVVLKGFQGKLAQSNITLNDQKIKNLIQEIAQKWEQVNIGKSANQLRGIEGKAQLKKIAVDILKTEISQQTQHTQQSTSTLNSIINVIGTILGAGMISGIGTGGRPKVGYK